MQNKALFLSFFFILSILTPLLTVAQTQYIPPTQLNGFHKIGSLPSNEKVIFTVYIPLKNLGLLYYYAYAVSNPSSTLYHHFLNKTQIEKLFYPTTEYEHVLQYLKENGFNILFTASDSIIVAEGSVAQIENTLGVNYAVYSNGSLTYYTVYGVPKLPVYVVSNNLTTIFFNHPTTLITQKSLEKFYQTVNQTFSIEAYWPTALQKVYNLTFLFNNGYKGQNYTIGILDFYGDPYIAQQLAYFDEITGLPNPPNFTIVPIGPYNPNLGILTGWAGEISLDVEIAHTMAPEANITLYIANPNLPLSAVISYIVSQDKVDVLSQSFSIPESSFSSFNGELFYSCVVLTDEYYAMGVTEGITFLASSGDAGGSGYSNGPIGTVGYPSVSPYVIAVGGTTTYIQFPNGSYYQTAWSNYGFVPNFINYGGSTGGISIVEPKPWYQSSLSTPVTYPNGRETPDVSANADVFPGIYIVCPGNVTAITGGTSEASPLTAGALVTVMSYLNKKLGLITPTLYMIAENSSLYNKVFYPITFGYNIPWTTNYGYNLVTGWGTINFGELATTLQTLKPSPSLSIVVNVYNTTGETPEEFFPGEEMLITANITYSGVSVSSGTFFATIESVYGNTTTVELAYNPTSKEWTATVTLPSTAVGVIFVYVYGSSDGIKGLGYYETFSGYYVQFLNPVTGVPFDSNVTPVIETEICNVYGVPAPTTQSFTLTLYSYNITTNLFADIGGVTLTYNPHIGAWVGILSSLPSGVILAEANGAYGFDAFMNGIYLQTMFILPDVIVEPGAVGGGQAVVIEGLPEPPLSLALTNPLTYNDILYGSNITAKLISPSGEVVSEARVLFNPTIDAYEGYLPVPKNVQAGVYTIILNAVYNSYTLGEYITGQFYGQIYVSPAYNVPQIETVRYAYGGETINIYANITYPNGTEVKFGMYSADVYPTILSGEYSTISNLIQIPLWYNPSLGLWVGNVTLPSSYSLGNLTYFATTYSGVPFDILVTGVSADGIPTTTNISAEHTFYVLPYTQIKGKTIDLGQTYNAYLVDDTIEGNVTLMNDILFNDTIEGHVTIINSNVSLVYVKDSSITIVSSTVNSIYAYSSNVSLVETTAEFLNLSSTKLTLINSKVISITPSLPLVTITSPKPNSNVTGTITISYTITGSDISEVEILLNGQLVKTFVPSTSPIIGNYSINTAMYPDGTYNITVVAVQNDGLSNSSSVMVNFANQLSSLSTALSNNVNSINSHISSLGNTLSSDVSTLNNNISSAKTYALIGIVLAIIGIIVGIVALVMRRR
ncbi:protease pro-enzyme activation domain-containing protein [Sulfurisphaera tokodaii]|uniref:Peptidase S53 family protein n=2 Tax=Sulfurisphaera tokodaii TaxID=111955 RepID=Q96XM6_SULTO|nr:protease pro-enzyme activation domain-containing protein [Sulfurisphaera tokodaii]BAB67601.1 putative peptidase S53 family protein [Sulfurisphaera tokodaii str. 7]HII74598.1 S8 family serine peptidase [Sulfurisphaera tokodaii]